MYWILFLGIAAAMLIFLLPLRLLWKRALVVKLRFLDNYIYEGESGTLREVIKNNKWLPLPAIMVRTAFDPHIRFTGEAAANSGVTDTTHKRDIFSLLYHQQVTRNLSFTAIKRGLYEIRETDVHAYDWFFRSIGYLTLPQSTMLYVYPAQVDTKKIDIICTAISGTRLVQNQLFPDPFEFSGIRKYQPTDPMNRINWKATLSTGDVMVNQFDSTTNMDITLVFDVEDSRILKEEELVEETIRIVSSLSARLVKARMPFDIYGNADTLSHMRMPANASHIIKLNQRLSRIKNSTKNCSEIMPEIRLSEGTSKVIILVSKNTDNELIKQINKCSDFCPVIWVVPCSPDGFGDKNELPKIHGVRILKWEVM
jgi:hypothetical protein